MEKQKFLGPRTFWCSTVYAAQGSHSANVLRDFENAEQERMKK